MGEIETIRIDFQVGGVRDVQAAFRTIEQIIERAERFATSATVGGTRERVSRARGEAKERATAAASTAAAARKAEESATKALLDGARLRIRERTQETVIAARELAKYQHAAQAAERAVTETTRRESRERERIARREASERERSNSAVRRRREQFGAAVGGGAISAVSSLGQFAKMGGLAAAAGGGFSTADIVRGMISTEQAAIALSNSAFNPNGETAASRKRIDPKELASLASRVQAKSGVGKDEFLRGAQDYIAKSSDVEALTTAKGQKTLEQLAVLSKATGTDFGQVMSAAGAFRVQNKGLGPEKMLEMMYSVVGQGKMGAVEMKDLAQHASVITSTSGKYSGNQTDAQRSLLGLSQIAMQTSGSPAEAATAVARFGQDVAKHGAVNKQHLSWQGEKFDVMNKQGQLRSPSEILAEYFRVTKGNTTQMGEGKGRLGLGSESIRIAEAMAPTYREAVEKAQIDAASRGKKLSDKDAAKVGSEAVRAEVSRFEKAGYDPKQITEDHSRVMAASAERMQAVWNRLKESSEAKLLPFLERFAGALEKHSPQIERALDVLAKVGDWAVTNPFQALGAVVLAAVAKDIAGAAIGEGVKRAITAAFGAGGGPGGAPGGRMGNDPASAAGAGLLAGFATLALAKPGIDAVLEGQTSGQQKTGEFLATMKNGSAAEKNQALAEYRRLQTEYSGASEITGRLGETFAAPFAAGYSAVTGEANNVAQSSKQREEAHQILGNEELRQLIAAMRDNTAATRASASAGGGKADPSSASRNLPQGHVQRGGTSR